jgi:hypothetical protein
MLVVDRLEVVEVEQDQGVALAAFLGAGERVVEPAPVADRG